MCVVGVKLGLFSGPFLLLGFIGKVVDCLLLETFPIPIYPKPRNETSQISFLKGCDPPLTHSLKTTNQGNEKGATTTPCISRELHRNKDRTVFTHPGPRNLIWISGYPWWVCTRSPFQICPIWVSMLYLWGVNNKYAYHTMIFSISDVSKHMSFLFRICWDATKISPSKKWRWSNLPG